MYVYAFNDDQRLYDAVSPNQIRIVNAQYKYQPTQFDIIVTFLKSKIKTEPIIIGMN